MLGSFRYCSQIRKINSLITISSNVDVSSLVAHSRSYSKDKGGCCKDISQTEGKKVVEWPKCDPPPPAWRAECPCEPQPPNYDPYRIKVPDIVVPPLPPSNAKEVPSEDAAMFNSYEINFGSAYAGVRDLFRNSPIIHPDCRKEPKKILPNPAEIQDPVPKLGYHGREKYKYAFHEPWKPLDRLTLLAEAEKDEVGPVDVEKDTEEQLMS